MLQHNTTPYCTTQTNNGTELRAVEDPQEVERERRERYSSTGVPPAGWSSVLVDQDTAEIL